MKVSRRVLLLTSVALVAVLGGGGLARGTPTDVFFSEYVEGSSFNKALEIYNGTGSPVDLAAGQYIIQMYFNGSTSPLLTIGLTGTVASGDVWVVTNQSASPAILAVADQITTVTSWFNGDDAVVLRKGGAGGPIVDVIGQIGFDPGAEWGSGLTSTADNTLRRKGSIEAGDTNGSDAFDPSLEWNGFAQDTFSGLGSHQLGNAPVIATCGAPLTTPEGVPATRAVSAADEDGRVVDIQVTSVTPSPAPGTISLSGLVPAPSTGGTATANVDVDAAVPAGTYTVLVTATNDDATPQTGTCTLTVRVAATVPIHDVQGAGHVSPFVGRAIVTQGIVTARRVVSGSGFYIQDPTPDADDATSEGIFVFTGGAPAVSVGDEVSVQALVTEFRPGATGLSTTELTAPSVTVISSGNALPPPTVVGAGGRVAPNQVIEDDAGGDVETGGVFDPANDGIDFYESLEAMRIRLDDAVASGPTSDFGEVSVLPNDGAGAGVRTARGGIVVRANDFNPERVILDDVLAPTPMVNTGDHFSSSIVGVLDYSFGNFKLLPTAGVTAVPAGLAREMTDAPDDREIAVATFNVENLDPGDPPSKFSELAHIIVDDLRSPDILSVEEVQDNNGETNDSVTDASVTWGMLVAAIQAAGGPVYEYRQIDPVDDADGGVPGGNIRVGFLFRTDREVEFIDRPGGDATTPTTVVATPSGPRLCSARAASTPETRPGRCRRGCASRWRASSGRRARSFSSSPITGSRRAATSRCSDASSRPR